MEKQLSVSTYTESSSKLTGSSSKSTLSGEGDIQRKEQDLTKDNVASPIDLECHIQCERINKILNEAIYKIKLAICLPDLVAEYKMLSSIVSAHHLDDLVFIFGQYDNPLFSASLLNGEILEEIRAGNLSLKVRLNPEMSHLIYILHSYPGLKPIVNDMITQKRLTYIKNPKSSTPINFLMAMEYFHDAMFNRMELTAAEELGAKIKLRKLEASNEKLKQHIIDITAKLKLEMEKFDKSMALKTDIITKLERELEGLNFDASIKLKKKILDSERQMVLATRAHVIKSEMLKEEEIETREGYEQLLKTHLIEEKNQRARRFKVETQLLSWLQKYDTEMTDKQNELDDFTQKFIDEEELCEELTEKIEEQNKEYIPLMAEREAEYQQEMTEKMNKFLLEHAARVIQNAWKKVLANRAEKKKLKKMHKKILAAKAKAERRAEIEARKEAKLARQRARAEKAALKKKLKEEKREKKEQDSEKKMD